MARRLGAKAFVRGLRGKPRPGLCEADMVLNRELAGELENDFLLSKPPIGHISSSFLRELIAFQQDIVRLCAPKCNQSN